MIEILSTLVRLIEAIVGVWGRDPQFRTLVGLVFLPPQHEGPASLMNPLKAAQKANT